MKQDISNKAKLENEKLTEKVNLRARFFPYVALFLGSLVFRVAIGLLYRQPGYTDAYYYTNAALSLWQGRGFREDYIWIYLGSPLPETALNNPSNTYWLPLTSVLIFFGYVISGGSSFLAAQMPIMVVSSLLPPIAYYMGKDIFGETPGNCYGWFMGLLTIFCGIFALYFALPDNFAPYALFSLLFLIFSYKALRLPRANQRDSYVLMALAGVTAGLAYLTRVDGVILLAVVPVSLLFYRYVLRQSSGLTWLSMGVMMGGFGLTISPWLLHNLGATGQLFPGGGIKTLFMREYNDFFSYHRPLNLPYYLNQLEPSPDWGIGSLLMSKLKALGLNTLILFRITLFIFTPFFGLGLFSRHEPGQILPQFAFKKSGTLWRKPEMLPFLVYLVMLYLAMSLAFTFPSMQGSSFHSSGGLIPFVAAFTLAGLDLTAVWVSRKNPRAGFNRAKGYTTIALTVAVIASVWLSVAQAGDWDKDFNQMRAVANWLDQNGAGKALVISPDPPAYYYANRRPSIMFSTESPEVNLEIARRYGAKYLILIPENSPVSFRSVYYDKGYPGFVYIGELGDIRFYRIE